MIVVIGLPAYTDEEDGERCAGGLVVEIAAEAHRRGGEVELAGKVGADGAGDSVVLALGRLGIGHAALLRDPARPTPLLVAAGMDTPDSDTGGAEAGDTIDGGARLLPAKPDARPVLEAGDVEMALRYLTGTSVLVVAEPISAAAMSAALDGAAFAAAKLVVIAGPDEPAGALAAVPDAATVLQAPAADDGSFARLVGAYAAGLDAGVDPATAFRNGVAAAGWEPSAD
jgi:hypothetical protein